MFINDKRAYTQAKGSKVQIYTADASRLLHTYASAISAERDPKLNANRPRINDAATNNKIYKGYRWALLDREKPDDTFQQLPPAIEQDPEPKKGYVAMLNLEKDKILNVFCDQKAAAEDRKIKAPAAISKAIKLGTLSRGHYFCIGKMLQKK